MDRKETTLPELIQLTQKFIKLADKLLREGKITGEEYDELTYVKKNFLEEAQSNRKHHTEFIWRNL